MSILISVFLAQVDGLLAGDNDEMPQIERYRQIKAAIERYNSDTQPRAVGDVTGDAGRYYALTGASPVLSGWVDGFSRIEEIEYPAATVASDETPVYLERESWRDDYEASSVVYLYLPRHAPAATETMRITYVAPYVWAVSSTTTAVSQTAHGLSVEDYVYLNSAGSWVEAADARIATHRVTVVTDVDNFTAALLAIDVPTQDFFALCYLGAGLCCQAQAAKYAKASDSTIAADSTTHTTRTGEFARRATEFIGMYEAHLGIGAEQGSVQGTGDFVDWDTAPGWPAGRGYLFHGNR